MDNPIMISAFLFASIFQELGEGIKARNPEIDLLYYHCIS